MSPDETQVDRASRLLSAYFDDKTAMSSGDLDFLEAVVNQATTSTDLRKLLAKHARRGNSAFFRQRFDHATNLMTFLFSGALVILMEKGRAESLAVTFMGPIPEKA